MVTLSLPSVAVVPVNPEPIVIVLVLEYLNITTPEPPAAPAALFAPCAPPPSCHLRMCHTGTLCAADASRS